jgi:anti-sigma regulatory factor (Ser/Thr protein kinase)
VVLVRQILTGIAESLDLGSSRLGGSELNDIRTAVTEACNNVVLHAYAGGEGPLEVELFLRRGTLEVVVRDHGVGLPTQAGIGAVREGIGAVREGIGAVREGIGLAAIRTLVHSARFEQPADGGTEIGMEFAIPGTDGWAQEDGHAVAFATDPTPQADGAGLRAWTQGELAGTMLLTLAPTRLAQTVLPRALSVLAADAHFSVDRISDTQLVADAIAAHAGAESSQLSMAARAKPRNLELRIGPLSAGAAQRLIADSPASGVSSALERLTDRREVSAHELGEMLTLGLVDAR